MLTSLVTELTPRGFKGLFTVEVQFSVSFITSAFIFFNHHWKNSSETLFKLEKNSAHYSRILLKSVK